MDQSPNLALPYIAAAQAQKHVTHNEAIRTLDALVQLAAISRTTTAPPAVPANGDRYIVPANPTGAFAGQSGRVAAWQDGAWIFLVPRQGWLAWIADESVLLAYAGAAWVNAATTSLNPTPLVGINATADATNRLAVSAPATLLNHAGAGHQLKLNKAAATDTASLLFQTGFSGRAEMGTTGNNDFHIKVSTDGVAWTEPLVANSQGIATLTLQPATDNAFTCGTPAKRWQALYAVNGVVQTSDARDKVITDTLGEATAGAIVDQVEPVLFRWRRDVACAGNNAPLQAGFRAQDIKSALDDTNTPCAAWGLDDAADPDSRQNLRPDQLIPILWAALRDTRARLAGR